MDTSAVGNFNTFFPSLMFVVMALKGVGFFNWVFRKLNLEHLQFGDAIASEKALNKSNQRLERERDRIERHVKREIKQAAMEHGYRRKSILQRAQDVMEAKPGGTQKFAGHAPESRSGWMEKKVSYVQQN